MHVSCGHQCDTPLGTAVFIGGERYFEQLLPTSSENAFQNDYFSASFARFYNRHFVLDLASQQHLAW